MKRHEKCHIRGEIADYLSDSVACVCIAPVAMQQDVQLLELILGAPPPSAELIVYISNIVMGDPSSAFIIEHDHKGSLSLRSDLEGNVIDLL